MSNPSRITGMLEPLTQTIEIVLNGERTTVPEGASILDVLQALKIDSARVAVELNRSIVRQPNWAATIVGAGAQMEIVQFVGGG